MPSQPAAFRERMAQRIHSMFQTSDPQTEGYSTVPSTTDYGATASTSAAAALPNHGMQVLGPDPTKIEPKVWLASERTFLNWLRVALLLSSFALALFNSAGPTDNVAKWMGFAYALIAILMLGYAWGMHQLRRQRIVHRFAGHHDELYGPVILVGLVFIAVLTNFILRVNQRETLRNHPTPKNPWINTIDLVKSAFVFTS